MQPNRRSLLGGLALAGAALPALAAETEPSLLFRARDELISLWPDGPPGGRVNGLQLKAAEQGHDPAKPDRWLTGIAKPLLVHRPAPQPNGAAVLLVPGGGYGFLSYDNEGLEQAAWLNARGVSAYILLYRLPGEGWADRALAPLQDAQRAMRVIRARAAKDKVQADKVMVLGFSAGGHLAGSLAIRHAERTYAPVDAADSLSAKPDLAALLYPVVSMSEGFTHGGSRDNLLGPSASEEMRKRFSLELAVTGAEPPMFLVHAGDDGLVPVANTVTLYTALHQAKDTVEMHVFPKGGHGFGVRADPALPVSQWPELLMRFARSNRIV